MKKLILVSITIVLMIGCSESVTGPDNPFEIPSINFPKDNIHIEVGVGDTVYVDWNLIAGCTNVYRVVISTDSSEVAKPDSLSRFVGHEIKIAPKSIIDSPQEAILKDGNKAILVMNELDFENHGDIIKIFWKIRGQTDEEDYLFYVEGIEGLYSNWSNIESFYVVNPDL